MHPLIYQFQLCAVIQCDFYVQWAEKNMTVIHYIC